MGYGGGVSLAGETVVSLELLGVREGIEAPIAEAASRHGLDREELGAAARLALASPDRVVVLEAGAKAPA